MKLNQITLTNIKAFVQSHVRQFLEDYPGIIDDFVYEQVQYRLGIMNEECLKNKSCIHCGCSCPDLQYSSKQCEGGEYPLMFKTEEEWEKYKEENEITKNLIQHNLYKRKDLIWPT